MKYDLEIPPLFNNKLVFIEEGKEINKNLCPLVYYQPDVKNLFPEDFVSMENAFAIKEFSADGYQAVQGPSFNITSDKILVTHISSFNQRLGVDTPLFYKHVIDYVVQPKAVKLMDYYGLEIDKSEYIIEVYNNKTIIYLNMIDDIIFVEYASNNKFSKEILNLVPVFQEVTWENLTINGSIIDFEYFINGDLATTTYNGVLYLSYINNVKMVRPPIGNLEDSWNISVLNSNFKIGDNIYYTPEFYTQRFNGGENLKYIEMKKCKKLYPDIIKSQYSIAQNRYGDITVYIKDFYTKETKYVFTTNASLIETEYQDGLYYVELTDYSTSGFIKLPISMKEYEVAYISHYYKEDYFVYPGLNINSMEIDDLFYAAVFLKPNMIDGQTSVGHKIIGNFSGINIEGQEDFYFNSYNDYILFIEAQGYMHLSLITASPYIDEKFITTYDIRKQNGILVDKLDACKLDLDILYTDILNGEFIIPTNDTVLVTLYPERLISEGKFEFDENGELTDLKSIDFIKMLVDKLYKNLDISTKVVLIISDRGFVYPILDQDGYLITYKIRE